MCGSGEAGESVTLTWLCRWFILVQSPAQQATSASGLPSNPGDAYRLDAEANANAVVRCEESKRLFAGQHARISIVVAQVFSQERIGPAEPVPLIALEGSVRDNNPADIVGLHLPDHPVLQLF